MCVSALTVPWWFELLVQRFASPKSQKMYAMGPLETGTGWHALNPTVSRGRRMRHTKDHQRSRDIHGPLSGPPS
jgi:hypothetical protein